MTAAAAVRSISGDASLGADPKDGVTMDMIGSVGRRLQHQLDILTSGRALSPVDRSSMLGEMTCMEGASSMQELEGCRNASEFALKPLMDEKFSLGLVRLAALQSQGMLDQKMASQIPSALSKISGEDMMSRLDITPEYRLLGYLANGGAIEQSLNKVDQEYSDIKFR